MKKWLMGIIGVLVILVGTAYGMAKSFLTKDYLVEKIEKSINSRVQIGELSVSLLGNVELKDVIITKRDKFANEKVAHDKRPAIDTGDLRLKSVKFRLSIGEMISRKVALNKIAIDGVKANVVMLEDGACNVEELFDKPEKKKKKAAKKNKVAKKTKTFNAKKNEKFVTEIKELSITNLDVEMVVQKTQLSVIGKGVYLKVTDINVNPKKLETINDANFEMGGSFDLASLDTNVSYGHIGLSGVTKLTLFNTESGDLEPDMKIDFTLSPDSYLTTKIPVINKVWESIWRSLDLLAKLNVDKVKLPERAEFRDDQKLQVAYKLGKVDLLEAFSVHLDDWELQALSGTYFNTGSDKHSGDMKLYVGQKISAKVVGFFKKSEKLSKLLGKLGGGGKAEQSWIEEGRVVIAVGSEGLLSDPKITLKNDLASPLKKGIEGLLDKENRKKLKKGKGLLKELKGFLR